MIIIKINIRMILKIIVHAMAFVGVALILGLSDIGQPLADIILQIVIAIALLLPYILIYKGRILSDN